MNAGRSLQAIIGGLGSGLCLLTFAVGGPLALFLSWIAAVPLFVVGLSMGPGYVLRGAIAGALAVGVFWMPALTLFVLVIGLPVVALTWAALTPMDLVGDGKPRLPDSGTLLVLMVGYATLIITVAAFAFSGYQGGLTGLLLTHMREPLQGVLVAMDLGFTDEEVERLAQSMAVSLPSALGLYWVLWTIVNMAVANSLLKRAGKSLRPDFGVLSLTPPPWASLVFMVLIAVSYATGITVPESVTAVVARNAVVLMMLVFFLVGLSVVHTITIARPGRMLILTLFYVLILASGWLALFVAGLGIIEQWVRLRERYASGRTDEED
jgi:hypothetical protein